MHSSGGLSYWRRSDQHMSGVWRPKPASSNTPTMGENCSPELPLPWSITTPIRADAGEKAASAAAAIATAKSFPFRCMGWFPAPVSVGLLALVERGLQRVQPVDHVRRRHIGGGEVVGLDHHKAVERRRRCRLVAVGGVALARILGAGNPQQRGPQLGQQL